MKSNQSVAKIDTKEKYAEKAPSLKSLSAARDETIIEKRERLAKAAKFAHWGVVNNILKSDKSLVNSTRPSSTSGWTALHQAALWGAPPHVLDMLIKLGANLALREAIDNKLPEEIAADFQHEETAKELKQRRLASLATDYKAMASGTKSGDAADVAEGENAKDNEEEDDAEETPEMFLDPIHFDIMADPHVAADGFSYDRESIEAWFEQQSKSASSRVASPMTGQPLLHLRLLPNRTLKSGLREWQFKREQREKRKRREEKLKKGESASDSADEAAVAAAVQEANENDVDVSSGGGGGGGGGGGESLIKVTPPTPPAKKPKGKKRRRKSK